MDPNTLKEELQKHLRTESYPIAIGLIKQGEELPGRTKRPAADMDIRITICQALSMSRRYGWAVAVGEEDISCPLANAVFGFKPMLNHMTEGNLCFDMYNESLEAGKLSEEEVKKFKHKEYEYIVSAPLHRTTFQPDLVIIYGNSAQVMRLVTAALWESGGRIESSFSGRIDCSDEIIAPLKSGKPEVILPCYGDRVFAQTQDHEMAFSFPWDWAEKIVKGFDGTHRGGVRYPIPAFLRYTPEYPPHYEKMNELWEKE